MESSSSRREYMKTYQKTRYNADIVKARSYQQSIKLKKKYHVDESMWHKYKHHLADVIRLTAMMKTLPKDIILDIVQNPPKELLEIEANPKSQLSKN